MVFVCAAMRDDRDAVTVTDLVLLQRFTRRRRHASLVLASLKRAGVHQVAIGNVLTDLRAM